MLMATLPDSKYSFVQDFILKSLLYGSMHLFMTSRDFAIAKRFMCKFYKMTPEQCRKSHIIMYRQAGKTQLLCIYFCILSFIIKSEMGKSIILLSKSSTDVKDILATIKSHRDGFSIYAQDDRNLNVRFLLSELIRMARPDTGSIGNILAEIKKLFVYIKSNTCEMESTTIHGTKSSALATVNPRGKNGSSWLVDEAAFMRKDVIATTLPTMNIKNRCHVFATTPAEAQSKNEDYGALVNRIRLENKDGNFSSGYLLHFPRVCETCSVGDDICACVHNFDNIPMWDDRANKIFNLYTNINDRRKFKSADLGMLSTTIQHVFDPSSLQSIVDREAEEWAHFTGMTGHDHIFICIDPPSHPSSFYAITAFVCITNDDGIDIIYILATLEKCMQSITDNWNLILEPDIHQILNQLFARDIIHDCVFVSVITEAQNNDFQASFYSNTVKEWCKSVAGNERIFCDMWDNDNDAWMDKTMKYSTHGVLTNSANISKWIDIARLYILGKTVRILFDPEGFLDFPNRTVNGLTKSQRVKSVKSILTQNLGSITSDGKRIELSLNAGNRDDLMMCFIFGLGTVHQYIQHLNSNSMNQAVST